MVGRCDLDGAYFKRGKSMTRPLLFVLGLLAGLILLLVFTPGARQAAAPQPAARSSFPSLETTGNSVATAVTETEPFLYMPLAVDWWESMTSMMDHQCPLGGRDGVLQAYADEARAFNVLAGHDLCADNGDPPTYSEANCSTPGIIPGYEFRTADGQWAWYDGHEGYDWGVPAGTAVYAAGNGTVECAGWAGSGACAAYSRCYGYIVVVAHAGGYKTLYAHLTPNSENPDDLGTWPIVTAEDKIALSGNSVGSGCGSSGAHLHFSLLHNGKYTDPFGWTEWGWSTPDPLANCSRGEASERLWVDDWPHRPGEPPNSQPSPPTNLRYVGGALTLPTSLTLPFSEGETWYVCQGYNGPTHDAGDIHGLDLSIDPASIAPGSTGCLGDPNASTDREVLMPEGGQVVRTYDDAVCVNLDSGKSMYIGHVTEPATGTLQRGDPIGRVAAPNAANGNYAHIHLQIHSGTGCAASGDSIPFADAYGTRFEGAPDLPSTGAVSEHRGTVLSRGPKASMLDVYMLVDLTGSFQDDLPVFKAQAPAVISILRSSYPDSRFGLGKFEDYPISPFGYAPDGDQAYERLVNITDDTDAVLAAIEALVVRSGYDEPESQLVALYQAATGAGQDLSGAGYPEASIAPGQQADFRNGVVKLFILWTDAPFHRPGDPGNIPYPGPSFDDTVSAVLALDPPMVVGISSGGGGLADLQAVAQATGALAPAGGVDCDADGAIDISPGDPLVCSISASGEGIAEAIVHLVESAAMLPVADAGGPYSGTPGQTVSFDGSGSYDPDGTILVYEWDFESDGVYDTSSSAPSVSHAYPAGISGTVTLRVTDNQGNQGLDTAPVRIAGSDSPVALYLPLVLSSAGDRDEVVIYADTADGELGMLQCADWAACRDSAWGNYMVTGYPAGTVSADYYGSEYGIKRILFFFDTSALPPNAVVEDATLSLYSAGYQMGSSLIHVVPSTAELPLSNDDYDNVRYESGGGAALPPNSWVNINLSPGARNWIARGAMTRLALIHDKDLGDSMPGEPNMVTIALAEDPAHRPHLTLTYSVP